MLLGLTVAVVAVVLYALAAVLQAVGARRVTPDPAVPTKTVDLLHERVWLLGVVLLLLAFLAFVLSTRVLPLPVAEMIRSSYPVLAVAFEHIALGTRLRFGELLGAAIVLIAPATLAASGGERGHEQPDARMAALMAAVLASVAGLSSLAPRLVPCGPAAVGSIHAVLSGIAFAVVDIGVRSIPSPFSVQVAMTTPACWVGALAAPVGLLLFSRAVALTTAGLATVLLTVVNVVVASVWSAIAFHDTSNAGSELYITAVIAVAIGLWLMARAARRVVMIPTPR